MTKHDKAAGAEAADPQEGPSVSVRVFGGITGSLDDDAIDFGGPRQRSVIGVLVAAGGAAVPAASVSAEIWGGDAATHPGTLQAAVSHLRRAMQPGSAARARKNLIASEGGGYALRLPRHAVDVWRFEDLVAAGVERGEDPDAVGPLREALALWRGVPYADAHGEWADAERSRLEALQQLAREHLVAARLAAGEHAALLPELEGLVAEDPLREDRWRLYALALYRCGRQAQALDALRDAKARLVDELGVDPGPGLRDLEAGILAHDPSLAPPVTAGGVTPSAGASDTTAPVTPAPAAAARRETRPRPDSLLVDRDVELAALTEAADQAASGFGGVALISGPAGIGKSRLLQELLGPTPEASTLVLAGRGSLLEREFGFGVVRQLFEPLLTDPEERERLLAGAASAAANVFVPGGTASSSGDSTFSTIHGLYWLVVRLAERGPVVLAVDDLQWCDTGTIRFLAFLARRIADQRVFVVATRRTGERNVDDAIVSELELDPGTLLVEPRPLTADGTAGVVRELLGEADAAFTGACHRTTGGNPLLVRQLLRALEAENVPPDADHADTVNAIGSRAVASVVVRRVDALGAAVAAVARAVAVLGDGCGLPTVAAFAELSEAEAADAAAVAADAEVLRDEHPLGFVHPLVQDAIYRSLNASRRGLAHDRAARLLAAEGASAEVVAAHLLLSPPRGDVAVVDQLRRAAEEARRRGTLDSAITYLTRAVAEPPQPQDRGPILADLGMVETQVRGTDALAHLLEARAALPVGPLSAEVAAVAALTLVFAGAPGEATRYAFAAEDELRESDPDVLQRLEAIGRAGGYMHGLDESAWQGRQGEPAGTGPGARMLAASRSWEHTIAGVDRDRAVELARFALEGTVLRDADPGLFWVMASMVLDLADQELGTFWDDVRAWAYLQGSLFSALSVHLWHGYTLLRRGDLRGGAHEVSVSIEQSMVWENGAIGAGYGLAFLVDTHLDRGDVMRARRALEGVDARSFAGDSLRLVTEAMGEVALAEGRPEEALRLFEEARTYVTDVANPAWNPWRSRRARALAALGRIDDAVALAAEEVTAAERWGAPRLVGTTLRRLGELQGPAGRDSLARAVEVLAPTMGALEHARALSALAEFESGPSRVAMLTGAYDLAQRCDAEGLRRDLGRRLRVLGAAVPPALTGLPRLATLERKSVELLADGLDVNEIAERLFVTPRGVRTALAQARAAFGVEDDATLMARARA